MNLRSPPCCLPLAAVALVLAAGGGVAWAALGTEPVPAPVARIDDGSRRLFAEVRRLQGRVARFRDPSRVARREAASEEPASPRAAHVLDQLEVQAVDIATERAMTSGRPGEVRQAVALWSELLVRGAVPLERRLEAYGALASLADPGVFAGPELGRAWVRDAHALAGDPALGSHLLSARHIASRDAAVREFLVGTAVFEADEALRSRAMQGLVHCGYSRDVEDAMRLIAATAPTRGLRAEALAWLRLAPTRQGEPR